MDADTVAQGVLALATVSDQSDDRPHAGTQRGQETDPQTARNQGPPRRAGMMNMENQHRDEDQTRRPTMLYQEVEEYLRQQVEDGGDEPAV